MAIQDVATSLAPWVAVAGGVSALAGTLIAATSRHRVATRLRADLAKDFELLKSAHALGENSSVAYDLTEMIQEETKQLADKTVYRPGLGLIGMTAGGSGLLLFTAFAYLGMLAWTDPAAFDEVETAAGVNPELVAGAAAISLLLGGLGLTVAAILRFGLWMLESIGPAESVWHSQTHRAKSAFKEANQARRHRAKRAQLLATERREAKRTAKETESE